MCPLCDEAWRKRRNQIEARFRIGTETKLAQKRAALRVRGPLRSAATEAQSSLAQSSLRSFTTRTRLVTVITPSGWTSIAAQVCTPGWKGACTDLNRPPPPMGSS